MGRTIPSWRMVVEREIEWMKNFKVFLRVEDKIVFEDMMNQCRLYASYASNLASPVTEVPLLISILFAQHKMLWEHQKYITKLKILETNKIDSTPTESITETRSIIETVQEILVQPDATTGGNVQEAQQPITPSAVHGAHQ